MFVETYSAAWLGPRTTRASFAAIVRAHSRVRVVCLDLVKAVIKTPMAGGKVDYDAVPDGASIWVTVTDESSPLHGRPILITKRPDGQFALEGGSGASHWHDKRIAARRHLVLHAGRVHATAADKQMAGKLAERDVKKEQYKAERRSAVVARQAAAVHTRRAFNLPDHTVFTRAENQRHRERVEQLFVAQGADPQEAKGYAAAVVRDMNVLTRRYYAYHTARRASLARDVVGGPTLLTMAEGDASPDPEATLAADSAHQFDYDPQAVVEAVLAEAKRKRDEGKKPLSASEAEVVAQQAGEAQLQGALDADTAPPAGGAPEDEPPAVTTPDPGAGAALPEQGEFGGGEVAPEEGAGEIGFTSPEEAAAQEPPAAPPPPPKPNKYTLAKMDAWQATTPAEANTALDAFRREAAAKGQATAIKADLQQYEGLRLISPTAVDRQALTADPVGDEEGERALDDLLEHYRQQGQVPEAGRFYGAIGDHWNDDIPYADGIGEFAEKGAISAVTGILGDADMLDARVDVSKLVRDLGIEGAAYALAGDIVNEHGGTILDTPRGRVNKVDQLAANLQTWNANTLKATEDKALDRHAELGRIARMIDQSLSDGELALEEVPEGQARPNVKTAPNALVRAIKTRANAEGTRLLADNIYAQRENLGSALGSMQMAATLLHALDSTIKAAKAKDPTAQFVTLYYGDNKEGRDEAMKHFRLKQGAMVADHDLRMGYALRVDTTSLRRYISRVKADNVRNLDWERTKGSQAGVQDVGGQEVVPDYKVPFFKDTFTDVDGTEKPSYFRRNQRNDIEWLRKSGGGVITRTTGAGKTNTTLGFYAHKLAENPDYHGAVAVPRGRAEQWANEAHNFTTLPVRTIPDNANPAQVAQHLRDYAAAPGGVLLLSHKLAARHADQLQQLYESGKLHGLTIDEPQEMMGGAKSAKLTAGAQQVLKVGQKRETVPTKAGGERVVANADPRFNRIALTATPAKREPVQAYDLVNWTNPKALGPRTKFRAAFSGFGGGTNAADNALARMVGREIGPYVSGDEQVRHPFDLKVAEHLVNRTPAQRRRQKEIEATAGAETKRLAGERFATLKRIPTNKGRSPQDLRREAGDWARGKLAEQHRLNLDAGPVNIDERGREKLADPAQAARDNAKVRELLHQVRTTPRGDKHVVFVDGAHQRAVVTQALKDEGGYSANAIKNITSEASPAEVEARKAAWKQGGPDVPFLLIDRNSASGHNLQEGDHLHVLAAPDDAAQLLQAQGRVARGNKDRDVTIHTYKTHDSPFETRAWEALDGGMKLMAATSPGLARKFVARAAQARDAALKEYAGGGARDEAPDAAAAK